MSDKLEKIFELQNIFEKRWFNFSKYSDAEKERLTIEFLGHIQDEIAECRAELPGRKHWKKVTKAVNERKLKLEVVDVFHFLITVCLIWEWDAKDIYKTFLHKHEVNVKRQDELGYGDKPKKL